MTNQEILALKAELEAALFHAFSDFKRISQVAIVSVELINTRPGGPLNKVIVNLERYENS